MLVYIFILFVAAGHHVVQIPLYQGQHFTSTEACYAARIAQGDKVDAAMKKNKKISKHYHLVDVKCAIWKGVYRVNND